MELRVGKRGEMVCSTRCFRRHNLVKELKHLNTLSIKCLTLYLIFAFFVRSKLACALKMFQVYSVSNEEIIL